MKGQPPFDTQLVMQVLCVRNGEKRPLASVQSCFPLCWYLILLFFHTVVSFGVQRSDFKTLSCRRLGPPLGTALAITWQGPLISVLKPDLSDFGF